MCEHDRAPRSYASTIEHQQPSGRRPEGCCHSIASWLAVRLHGECQNVGGFVPLLARDVGARRSLIAGSIAPSELYRTSYHRHAVDGLPRRHRYKTACLGRIGSLSETYNHLGLDPARQSKKPPRRPPRGDFSTQWTDMSGPFCLIRRFVPARNDQNSLEPASVSRR